MWYPLGRQDKRKSLYMSRWTKDPPTQRVDYTVSGVTIHKTLYKSITEINGVFFQSMGNDSAFFFKSHFSVQCPRGLLPLQSQRPKSLKNTAGKVASPFHSRGSECEISISETRQVCEKFQPKQNSSIWNFVKTI